MWKNIDCHVDFLSPFMSIGNGFFQLVFREVITEGTEAK
jgi:hypothetical protein